MFLKILHLNLIVSDFERSYSFYTDVMGLEEVKRFDIGGVDFEKGVGIKEVRAEVAHLRVPGSDILLEISQYW